MKKVELEKVSYNWQVVYRDNHLRSILFVNLQIKMLAR